MEYTFSMIKPDATSRNIIGKIIQYLESQNLEIVAQKMIVLTEDEASQFYAEHSNKPFFHGMIHTITSGRVVVQVLRGVGAVRVNRQIMGATNPLEAEVGTIRRDFGLNIEQNSIHGSDSLDSAKREIEFFFGDSEIIKGMN